MVGIKNGLRAGAIFRGVAERFGEQPALRFNGESVSYRELDERSERLAMLIVESGVEAGSIIAVIGSKGPELISAILAVLKAGCAYLPVEASNPAERTAYMLADCGSPLILTNDAATIERFSNEYRIFDLRDSSIYNEGKGIFLPLGSPSDPAYLIYTSGSTGEPKGVLVSQANLVNFVKGSGYLGLAEGDICLHFASFAFDASIIEIFCSLLQGLTLVITDPAERLKPDYLKQLIESEGVSAVFLTTALFNTLLDYDPQILLPLRKIAFGGEAHSILHVRRAFELLGPGRLIHVYGPTETTVLSTFYQIDSLPHESEPLPIGRAVPGAELFVTDENGRPVKRGEIGELRIGGAGVALGYLNDGEKTGRLFVPHPLKEGERLYCTGDLVWENEAGELIFSGRRDGQVKIRGFRIELSELEEQIRGSGLVEDVVVTVREGGGGRLLAAYCISRKGERLEERQLMDYLADRLPEYMLPHYLVEVESFPLNQNGKIDRQALPEPAGEGAGVNLAPELSEAGAEVLAILEGVLNVRASSLEQRFAELGGSSLNSMLIIKELERAGYSLALPLLLTNPTVDEICRRTLEAEKNSPIREPLEGPVPLAHSQAQTINLYEGICPELDNWFSTLLLFREERFELELLERCARGLLERHPALVSRFELDGEQIVGQSAAPGKCFELASFDLSHLEGEELGLAIRERAVKLFESGSLAEGALFRLALFQGADGDHLLFLVNQLVCDGFSLTILLTHFAEGYEALKGGAAQLTASQGESFHSWCLRVERYKEEALKHLSYWQSLGLERVKPLPRDLAGESNLQRDAGQLRLVLPPEMNGRLEELVKREGLISYETVIIYLVVETMRRWSGQDLLRVDLINNGRYALQGSAVGETVGAFAHDFPLLIDCGGREGLELLAETARSYREVPEAGISFRVIEELLHRDKRLFPEREILCNYLGPMDALFGLPGLSLSPYELSDLAPGTTRRDYSFLFNCFHLQGALIVDLDYNRGRYSEETIERLRQLFEEAAGELAQ